MDRVYKFRLTFSHALPGFFNLDCNSFGYEVDKSVGLEIHPRDSDQLNGATKYHIDCGGFESEKAALDAGERLRRRLRLLNSVLDLGLSIPIIDEATAKSSEAVKNSVLDVGSVDLTPKLAPSAR